MTDPILTELEKFRKDAAKTNSSNDKKEVLKKYPHLKEAFEYIHNPFKLYGVKSEVVQKKSDLVEKTNLSLFQLLDKLNAREYTGHKAISVVNGFIENNKKHEELIYLILDRNLKVRIDISLINKVYPNLIPEFDVALAEKFEDAKALDLEKDTWVISRKMDGTRVITHIDANRNVKFFSRAGNEFTTLENLKTSILSNVKGSNIALDGECCILDEDGSENFTKTVGDIKRKDYTIKAPVYYIFDYLPAADFFDRYSNEDLLTRLRKAKANITENKNIKILKQDIIKSESDISDFMAIAEKNGWEGAILRKASVNYQGKRSKDILKVKKFFDAEYKVLDVVNGKMRVVENNKEVERDIVAALVIDHKGNKVQVGSGMSIEQRMAFFKNPKLITGKTITVKYFEESKNKDGGISLRFPTLKAIYDGSRNI